MTYEKALKACNKNGVCQVSDECYLAALCETLCTVHRGVNPEMVYDGARKKNLSSNAVAKLALEAPTKFADLMFV